MTELAKRVSPIFTRSANPLVWFDSRLSIGSRRFIGCGRRRRGGLVTGAVSDVAVARPVRQYAWVAVEFVAGDYVELAYGL